ncbi:MAG: hypothetical protein Q4F05_05870 [bacterium]|nr:hypothetical protein [bacterium]
MEEHYLNLSGASLTAISERKKQLIEIIERQPNDSVWKINQQHLHNELFFLLSTTYFDQVIYVVGDAFTVKCIEEYSKMLRQNNVVEAQDTAKLIKDGEKSAFSDEIKNYSFVIVPWEVSVKSLIMERLEKRTLRGSQLVIYNVPETFVKISVFGIYEKNNHKEWSALEQALLRLIDHYNKELLAFNEPNTAKCFKEPPSEQVVDVMIKEAQLAENYANKYYQQIGIVNLKDDINELKNALLDYRYGNDKEYFLNEIMTKMSLVINYMKPGM